MRGPAKRGAALGFGVLTLVLAAAAAQAGDPETGLRIAKRWCSSCHVVAPGAPGSDVARPFEAMANDANFTRDGLRAWLVDPHPPMPDLVLTREEVDSVLDYIQSLHRE